MHVCASTHMRKGVIVFVYLHIHIDLHIYIHFYRTHVYVYVYAFMYIHECPCICMYIYIYLNSAAQVYRYVHMVVHCPQKACPPPPLCYESHLPGIALGARLSFESDFPGTTRGRVGAATWTFTIGGEARGPTGHLHICMYIHIQSSACSCGRWWLKSFARSRWPAGPGEVGGPCSKHLCPSRARRIWEVI